MLNIDATPKDPSGERWHPDPLQTIWGLGTPAHVQTHSISGGIGGGRVAELQPLRPFRAAVITPPGQQASIQERLWVGKLGVPLLSLIQGLDDLKGVFQPDHSIRLSPQPPAPQSSAPPCPSTGASRPALPSAAGARRLQIPTPSRYLLHAGECSAARQRQQRFSGWEEEEDLWVCFLLYDTRVRELEAGSSVVPSPALPCCMAWTSLSDEG